MRPGGQRRASLVRRRSGRGCGSGRRRATSRSRRCRCARCRSARWRSWSWSGARRRSWSRGSTPRRSAGRARRSASARERAAARREVIAEQRPRARARRDLRPGRRRAARASASAARAALRRAGRARDLRRRPPARPRAGELTRPRRARRVRALPERAGGEGPEHDLAARRGVYDCLVPRARDRGHRDATRRRQLGYPFRAVSRLRRLRVSSWCRTNPVRGERRGPRPAHGGRAPGRLQGRATAGARPASSRRTRTAGRKAPSDGFPRP